MKAKVSCTTYLRLEAVLHLLLTLETNTVPPSIEVLLYGPKSWTCPHRQFPYSSSIGQHKEIRSTVDIPQNQYRLDVKDFFLQ